MPGLLDKIKAWIMSQPLFEGLKQTIWAWSIKDDEINRLTDCNLLMELYRAAPMWKMPRIYQRMQSLGCPQLRAELKTVDNVVKFAEDPSTIIGTLLNEGMNNRITRETAETFGAVLYDAIMGAALGSTIGIPNVLLERIRRFIGTVMLLSVGPRVAGAIAAGTTGGKMGILGQILHDAYFNLGLGFITWQMTSPLITSAIGADLERAANRKYRPTRFTLSQYLELYAKGFVSANELVDGLYDLGYRSEDIQKVLALSYRNLSESQVQELYENGLISTSDAVKYLRAMGYSPMDISYVMKLWDVERMREQKSVMLSTARSAFEKGLISESKFRDILKDLKFSAEAIDIEVRLIRAKASQQQADLTVSQIKEAFQKGVIGEPEARKSLLDMGYSTDEVSVLIDTWKAESKPQVLRLNRTSILEAMSAGVIDETTARNKLRELGYTPEDIDILIRTHYKQSEKKPPAVPVQFIAAAYKAGIIDRNEAVARLKDRGYPADDIELILKLSEYQAPLTVSRETIVSAYVKGVLTLGEALQRLVDLGMSQEDAQLTLRTAKAQAPTSEKKLSISYLAAALNAGIITRETFTAKARALGYSDEDVEILLNLATFEPPETIAPSAAVGAYRYGVISRDKAKELLLKAGFSDEYAELRLATVDAIIAREAPAPSLSALMAAFSAGIITQAEFADRLEKMGYAPADIDIFIKMATYEVPPAETPLTKTEILQAYKALIFSRGEAMARLTTKGYSVADAEVLIKLQGLKPMDTVVHKLVAWGLMDIDSAVEAFRRLGFPEADIQEYMQSMGVTG
jgi:Holliday junction resolvasome RuvABC DNA-binding subunit